MGSSLYGFLHEGLVCPICVKILSEEFWGLVLGIIGGCRLNAVGVCGTGATGGGGGGGGGIFWCWLTAVAAAATVEAAAAAANPWNRALRLSANGLVADLAAAMWACKKGNGKGKGRRGKGRPSRAKRSAWAAAAAAACCCCCLNCMNWVRPFSNILTDEGVGLMLWGRAKDGGWLLPPNGGGDGGEYSLITIFGAA